MTGPDRCPNCGSERPDGLCPKCMLLGVLNADDSALETTPPPGVLDTLGLTCGPMPRVLLRDTEPYSGPGPVVRPSSDQMPDPSERAGRIQLLGEIARGGMGAVLKGRDNDLGRDLAVKVLLERHGDKPDLVRRFVEEAQIAGQLQHPGVVPIYELGTFADHRPYFAMKLVKGRTLAEVLAERFDLARRPSPAAGHLPRRRPDDGLRPRPGRHPPRPEALERDGRLVRRGPGDGLGPGQGPAPRRCGRGRAGRQAGGVRDRHRDRRGTAPTETCRAPVR